MNTTLQLVSTDELIVELAERSDALILACVQGEDAPVAVTGSSLLCKGLMCELQDAVDLLTMQCRDEQQ